jgi:hypothetical protein
MKMEEVRKLYGVRKGSLEDKTIKKVRQQVRKVKPKK